MASTENPTRMRTNADITIYNKYTASHTDAWRRSVVYGVFWENTKASNVRATGGEMYANQATVYLPFSNGSKYLAPTAWTSAKTGKFTLKPGDVIVKGVVTDEISGSFTMTDLRAKYDNVLTISSVDTKDFGTYAMQHWQIGAR